MRANANLWPAPAKLNLFLHITGRRPDGYHELQTVFQILDFGDELEFAVRDDAKINRLSVMEGVAETDDLCVRAAQMLQQETGCRLGVNIRVRKRIPMGGGLGGGSSDAATTLVALNYIWQLHLSTERLAQLGVSLGADVPVFIWGDTAWGEGIGERLSSLALDEIWYVVVTPNVSVST
jgi:4-diphosphocytidyl-2-C-methyl-D-erythritol kinase